VVDNVLEKGKWKKEGRNEREVTADDAVAKAEERVRKTPLVYLGYCGCYELVPTRKQLAVTHGVCWWMGKK
jgi:hypothetical protein